MTRALPEPNETAEIAKASAGLLYPSETDTPFEVFRWNLPAARTAKDAVVARCGGQKEIKEQSLKDFFAELEASDDGERFRKLRAAIEAALAEPRAFRVGRTRVDVYVLGKTRSGAWAGVHTVSVET